MTMPILLMVYLSFATIMDIAWHKVKNAWILYGLISGLTISFLDCGLWGDGGCYLEFGSGGLILSIAGIFLSASLILLYFFRLLGAGDIKLLMVIGAFLGASNLGEYFPFMFISTFLSGIIYLIYHHKTLFKETHYMPMAPVFLIGEVLWILCKLV